MKLMQAIKQMVNILNEQKNYVELSEVNAQFQISFFSFHSEHYVF